MLQPAQFISASLLNSGIVLIPVLVYAAAKKSKPIFIATCLTFAIFIAQAFILVLPNFGIFHTLKYNWFQKALMILLVFAAAKIAKVQRADWGCKRPDNLKDGMKWAVLLGVLTSLPSICEILLHHAEAQFQTEFFIFELTMPGLHEEPLYRGLLLCIWDRVLGRPLKVLGTEMGAGVLITSALFVLGHTILFDKNFCLQVAGLVDWFDLIFFSVAMCWLRYRSNSFLPPVTAHNLGNAGTHLLQVFLSKH